jgi:hypothetical protein
MKEFEESKDKEDDWETASNVCSSFFRRVWSRKRDDDKNNGSSKMGTINESDNRSDDDKPSQRRGRRGLSRSLSPGRRTAASVDVFDPGDGSIG